MSDYLSNLAARGFNQTQVLRPRLASRFEPLSIASNSGFGPGLGLEQQSTVVSNPNSDFELSNTLDAVSETLTPEAGTPQHRQFDPRLTSPSSNGLTSSRLEMGGETIDTELRSNIVDRIDAGTRGHGDAEKMNVLRMNATWYEQNSAVLAPPVPEAIALHQPLVNSKVDPNTAPSTRQNLKAELPAITNLELNSQQESQPPILPSQLDTVVTQVQPLLAPTIATVRQQPLDAPQPKVIHLIESAASDAASMPVLSSDGAIKSTAVTQPLPPQSVEPPTSIQTEQSSTAWRGILANPAANHSPNATQDNIQNAFPDVQVSNRQLALEPRLNSPAVKPAVTAHQPALTVMATEPAQNPTPTIQVTIGRIEVRATPASPPSPSPKQRSAPAVMGLDDYLHQRAKGASQ